MTFLNSAQILLLKNNIDQAVSMRNLREDLLDHLCCAVEAKLKAGKTFADAVEEAMHEIAPDGFREIEDETNNLLHQNYIRMKKLLYSFGLATAISMAMGLMMKLLHMPGGEELINYGFLSFSLIFLPVMITMNSKSVKDCTLVDKLKIVFGITSATLMAITICLKIAMNLTASEVLFMTGTAIFSFGFLPCVFYGLYQKSQVASA